ncbi:Uncharacterized conserved protein, DUF2252 family [Pseudonocardia ammonioxydans]|uniref:Uncharacterized conserved protein, DUF2252 family n=1 Tax=Pseudonocardia ammonioxydans TaxID=260086 RepID=A0A1I5CH66_PSUAM|nr:DUF2252 domain-containing protein [Pseudonocardia ammonioxydans]SFN86253.1 Uncharacterized conserved protein, DUF2252 family [Pseudonocardia ammonioxydans]
MTTHPVLAGSDRGAFGSLHRRSTPRAERYRVGKDLRATAPRSSLATWSPALRRVDPVDLVEATNAGRVTELIPLRIQRMSTSPHAFLRGAAALHAADSAVLPATGIRPIICGDAHLGNFGFYASPERALVFDLNDFDEAHPGAWEWDLRRLVASTWVAGRDSGASEQQCGEAVARCAHAYAEHLWTLAEQPLLARSFDVMNVDTLRADADHKTARRAIDKAAQRARRRTSDRALPRFVTDEGGERRIVTEPPLIAHPDDERTERILAALDDYLATLPSHWARILGGYHATDVAHKVVGVGSVGLRAYLVLCEGSSPDDVLFLQLKQARRSVVAPYVHGDEAWHAHQGQRVVEYQQALQTVSDPLLGWTTVAGRQYYVRQFRDMKGAIVPDTLDAPALADYADICGKLLAKGHARTSGASMIAGYLGKGGKVADALCTFARAYADQTEADHAALLRAIRSGRLSDRTPEQVPGGAIG